MNYFGYRLPQDAEICVAQFVTVAPSQEIRYYRMLRGQLFPEDEYYMEPAPPRFAAADGLRSRYYSMDDAVATSLGPTFEREYVYGVRPMTRLRSVGADMRLNSHATEHIHTVTTGPAEATSTTWQSRDGIGRSQADNRDLASDAAFQRSATETTPRVQRAPTPRSAAVPSTKPAQVEVPRTHDQPELHVSPRGSVSVASDSCLSVQFLGGIERALARSDSETSVVSMSGVTRRLPQPPRPADRDTAPKSSPPAEHSAEALYTPERHRLSVKRASPKKGTKQGITRVTSDRDSTSRLSSTDSIGHSSFNDSLGRCSGGSAAPRGALPSVGNILTWNRPRPGGLEPPANRSPTRAGKADASPTSRTPSSRASLSDSMRSTVSRGTVPSARSSLSLSSSAMRSPTSQRKNHRAPAPPPSTPHDSPIRRRGSAGPKLPIRRPESAGGAPRSTSPKAVRRARGPMSP